MIPKYLACCFQLRKLPLMEMTFGFFLRQKEYSFFFFLSLSLVCVRVCGCGCVNSADLSIELLFQSIDMSLKFSIQSKNMVSFARSGSIVSVKSKSGVNRARIIIYEKIKKSET